MKVLENLINDIKQYGFNRAKQEIEEKVRIKQQIEANIEALQKKKTNLYLESKQLNTNNSKIIHETHVYQNKGERMRREVYFFNKDIPNIYQDIDDVKMNFI